MPPSPLSVTPPTQKLAIDDTKRSLGWKRDFPRRNAEGEHSQSHEQPLPSMTPAAGLPSIRAHECLAFPSPALVVVDCTSRHKTTETFSTSMSAISNKACESPGFRLAPLSTCLGHSRTSGMPPTPFGRSSTTGAPLHRHLVTPQSDSDESGSDDAGGGKRGCCESTSNPRRSTIRPPSQETPRKSVLSNVRRAEGEEF